VIGRASRRQVETLFAQLVRKLGPVANGWGLEWITEYGGYVVTSDNGAGRPMGHRRRSASEMRDAIGFAMDLLWHTPTAAADGCSCTDGAA
jgi:hypothetical protein